MKRVLLIAVILLLAFTMAAFAAPGGENVFGTIPSDSWVSEESETNEASGQSAADKAFQMHGVSADALRSQR